MRRAILLWTMSPNHPQEMCRTPKYQEKCPFKLMVLDDFPRYILLFYFAQMIEIGY